MSKWVYTDDRGCIYGINPNDMTGNTGWQEAEGVALTVDDALFDEHGAALYKLENGAAVARTEAERRGDWMEDEAARQQPSTDERLDEIEAAMIELAGMIGGME